MFIVKNYALKVHISHDNPADVFQTFMQFFGCARKVYNLYTEYFYDFLEKADYEKGELPDGLELPEVTFFKNKEEYAYLKKADSLALSNAKLNFEAAVKKFRQEHDHKTYTKGSLKRAKASGVTLSFRQLKGMPKFKSKRRGHFSYTTNNRLKEDSSKDSIRLNGDYLHLPKFKEDIILDMHRELPKEARIKNITISKAANGEFYASINYEIREEVDDTITNMILDNDTEAMKRLKFLGLDYSQEHLYVDNEGQTPNDIHYYKRSEEKLAKLQRQLSHMEYGSTNYNKQLKKIQKLHFKIANQRKDALHKISTTLVKEYDVIVVEDINLRGMAGGLHLGKNLMDNGFGMFRQMLSYKLEKKGSFLVKVDKWFPSSQLCNVCGYKYKELGFQKEWECPHCHTFHNRDENAAINIVEEGKHIFAEYYFWAILHPQKNIQTKGKKYHKNDTKKDIKKAA